MFHTHPLAPSSCAGSPSRLLTRVAMARGATNVEAVREFIDPSPVLRNPLRDYPTLTAAAFARVQEAISNNEPILVWGDYDVDGITATVQLVRYLRSRASAPDWFIPDRATDGYGLTPAAACRVLAGRDPGLLISVDCGTTATDTIAMIQSWGWSVIVIDHHTPHRPLPEGTLHLNPQACGPQELEAGSLCASALVFCLLQEFFRYSKETQHEFELTEATVLAGLATLADVMRLTGFNRSLVKRSLQLINRPTVQRQLPGISAILESNRGARVTEWTYAFHLGPVLNAAGRISTARTAVELLLSRDPSLAQHLSQQAIEINDRRRREQQIIMEEATILADQLLQRDPSRKVIVLQRPHWHPGIVGIIASQLRERLHHPCFLFGHAFDSLGLPFWQGSGRSVPGYDLGAAVKSAVAAGVAKHGGGHAAAAGASLTATQFDGFAEYLESRCELPPSAFHASYETLPNSGAMTLHDWRELYEALAPFGMGNGRPVVHIPRARLIRRPRHFRTLQNGRKRSLGQSEEKEISIVELFDLDTQTPCVARFYGSADSLPSWNPDSSSTFQAVIRLQLPTVPVKKVCSPSSFSWVLEKLQLNPP